MRENNKPIRVIIVFLWDFSAFSGDGEVCVERVFVILGVWRNGGATGFEPVGCRFESDRACQKKMQVKKNMSIKKLNK